MCVCVCVRACVCVCVRERGTGIYLCINAATYIDMTIMKYFYPSKCKLLCNRNPVLQWSQHRPVPSITPYQ